MGERFCVVSVHTLGNGGDRWRSYISGVEFFGAGAGRVVLFQSTVIMSPVGCVPCLRSPSPQGNYGEYL